MEHRANGSRRAVPNNLLLGLLLAMIAFHAAVQVLTIGASLLAIPIGRPIAIGILTTSAVLGWLAWRSRTRQASSSCTSGCAAQEFESPGFLPWMILSVAALTYVVLLGYSIVGHDTTCDGSSYHIPTIHAYLTDQRVCWIEEPFVDAKYMNGYPKGAELFAMILVQAFHPVLLDTANVLFLPLGFLGVAYLARSMGASSSLSLLAGTAWLLLPVNVCQAGTTYVDSSYASCVVAYVAILFSVMRGTKILQVSEGLSRWMPAVILGCALGLAIGMKSSGIAIGALGIVGSTVFWVLTMARNQHGRWTRHILVLTGFFGIVMATGAAVGGYWYLRNWVMKGSPLYPVGVVVAGHRLFPGLSLEAIGLGAMTPRAIRDLPTWKALLITWLQIGSPGERWPRSIMFVDSRLGGLGYLWIVGCVPATCWFLVRASFHRDPIRQPSSV